MALVQDPNSPVQKYTTMFGRDYVESGIFKYDFCTVFNVRPLNSSLMSFNSDCFNLHKLNRSSSTWDTLLWI
jgi:hypothetical protein